LPICWPSRLPPREITDFIGATEFAPYIITALITGFGSCRKIVDKSHGWQGPSCSCGCILRFVHGPFVGLLPRESQGLYRCTRIRTINLLSTLTTVLTLTGFPTRPTATKAATKDLPAAVAAVCDFYIAYLLVFPPGEITDFIGATEFAPYIITALITGFGSCRKIVDKSHGCQGPSCSCGCILRFLHGPFVALLPRENQGLYRCTRIRTINLLSTLTTVLTFSGFPTRPTATKAATKDLPAAVAAVCDFCMAFSSVYSP
jgi:hypothetical protein